MGKIKNTIIEKKDIHIRAPKSYYENLEKIARSSGLSVNSLCLELLREGIRNRLIEMKIKDIE